MQQPRQLGAPSREIQCSRGADQTSAYGFYSTSYGKSFSRPQFIPKASLRDRSTGYASNFRPSVSYNYRLDENDNPTLGKFLHENKSSTVYRKDYDFNSNFEKYPALSRKAIRSDSAPTYSSCPPFFQLPTATYQTDMGYTKDIPITRPFTRDVCSVHVDTRELGPKQVLGRTLPHFSEPKGSGFTVKTRVEEENAGLGPLNFSTEQKASFPSKINGYYYEGPKQISIGSKEETGFTHSKKIEPITFRKDQAFQDETEIPRRTLNSLMKEDFEPKSLHPYQHLPNHYRTKLCKSADITNGFIKGHRDLPEFLLRHANIDEAYTSLNQIPPLTAERAKRSNPAEYMNMRLTNQKCSITQDSFPLHTSDRLPHPAKDRNILVGRKEESGYVENKEESTRAPSGPAEIQSQFTTHYSEQYNRINPSQISRVSTAPQLPLMNGYTKSTRVHSMGQEAALHPDSTNKLLRDASPIVAKIMLAKDPMLTDMPHLHKSRNVTSAVY